MIFKLNYYLFGLLFVSLLGIISAKDDVATAKVQLVAISPYKISSHDLSLTDLEKLDFLKNQLNVLERAKYLPKNEAKNSKKAKLTALELKEKINNYTGNLKITNPPKILYTAKKNKILSSDKIAKSSPNISSDIANSITIFNNKLHRQFYKLPARVKVTLYRKNRAYLTLPKLKPHQHYLCLLFSNNNSRGWLSKPKQQIINLSSKKYQQKHIIVLNQSSQPVALTIGKKVAVIKPNKKYSVSLNNAFDKDYININFTTQSDHNRLLSQLNSILMRGQLQYQKVYLLSDSYDRLGQIIKKKIQISSVDIVTKNKN